jgi:acyl-CoA dehydrogenase
VELIIFIIGLLIIGFLGLPLFIWLIFIGIYSITYFDIGIISSIIFLIFSLIFLYKDIRKYIISRNILSFINKNKLLPKISPTEEEALVAGTKWIESDFFESKIDFNKIDNEKINKVTQEEREFLNNEVEELCNMTTDWEIFQKRDMSSKVWKYIKDKKFFGMIIPKEYGGLGFSATLHSLVIEKLVSRSQVLAITIMVPNSLGPAELILKHGSKKQKDLYLPKLANGKEVPCFGLTETFAGSDATSIQSNGIVFKDTKDDKLKIKLNFEKRYITLGNVATLIGIAFKLYDPNKLLGDKKDLGITFALVKSTLEGVDNSKRHDPLGVPFVNSPLYGKNVIINISDIIGDKKGIGKGWSMLVESLSIGRGISLPSVSLGGSKLALKTVSSYTQIREQFGLSINNFEGVEEKIAKIASFTYMLNASRNFTIDAIDNGNKPGVVNSIMKYHATEKFREVINDSMDVLGGSAIIRGEKNILAHAYFALPISITVEGANILTRNLMQFGQGLIKCHPYLYNQVNAIKSNNIDEFDKLFFSHIKLVNTSIFKSIIYYFTRGRFILIKSKNKNNFKRYKQKLVWITSIFTSLSNISLIFFGAQLKQRENIGARFGDILSWCYLITSTLRQFDNNPKNEHKNLVDWICNYGFNKIQIAREEIIYNMPFFKTILPFVKLNPIGIKTKDNLNNKIVSSLNNQEVLDALCEGIFKSKDPNDTLNKMDYTLKLMKEHSNIFKKVTNAVKENIIQKDSVKNMINIAYEKKILSKSEYSKLNELYNAKKDVIEVDSFDSKIYKKQK